MLPVEILVQTVVVARPVLQQERSRSPLAGSMAAFEELGMRLWETCVHTHTLVPLIGDRSKLRINRSAQILNQWRQRIGEIAIFTLPEAVPSHDDAAAECFVA